MDKYSTRDIAFFNILETATNLNLNEEKSNFKISTSELSKKIDISREDIIKNLKSLDEKNFLTIKKIDDDSIVIDVTNYSTKLSEMFSQDEISKIIQEFDFFIKKYDHLIINSPAVDIYAEYTKDNLSKMDDNAFNKMIEEGMGKIYTEEVVIILEKKIYNMCEFVDESDLEIIEVILFCMYNFNINENPFFVTLFLASIMYG